jgi:hypothetical protein
MRLVRRARMRAVTRERLALFTSAQVLERICVVRLTFVSSKDLGHTSVSAIWSHVFPAEPLRTSAELGLDGRAMQRLDGFRQRRHSAQRLELRSVGTAAARQSQDAVLA